MSQVSTGRASRSMTMSENAVVHALVENLPDTYRVTLSPERVQFPESWRENRLTSYEPDLEVVDQAGKRLIVEVKSVNALSLSNMVRFVEIAKAIQQAPDSAFLVIVLGGDRSNARFRQYPGFEEVRIRYASSPSDVVREIEQEFSELRHG